MSKFGALKLSVKGTNNGRGFDIFYDFGKSHNFVEFTSKSEFYFIQPWMQFPSQEYTDECMRVSIELVHRFNDYEKLKEENEKLKATVETSLTREESRVKQAVADTLNECADAIRHDVSLDEDKECIVYKASKYTFDMFKERAQLIRTSIKETK